VLAWTADGTDYVGMGQSVEPDFEHGWPVVLGILEQAEGPLTRRAILRRWPDTAVAPSSRAWTPTTWRAFEPDAAPTRRNRNPAPSRSTGRPRAAPGCA
jgi:hypothetical protein